MRKVGEDNLIVMEVTALFFAFIDNLIRLIKDELVVI